MGRLDGKVAVVTGASQGMGAAHAKMMVKEGAKVIMTDINAQDGQALADELGENALFVKQDVSSVDDWANVVAKGEEAFGTVNVLVNNAGIIGPVSGALEMTPEQFQQVCDINQLGVFLGMQAVLPSMLKAGVGSIINISSIAGIVAVYGSPNIAYVASKFAVRGMTKQMAIEYGDKNIRVNSVHPGFIKTPMMVAATDEGGGDALSMIPLARMAETSEVANLIVFLASDESSFITATEQIIDGGMVAL